MVTSLTCQHLIFKQHQKLVWSHCTTALFWLFFPCTQHSVQAPYWSTSFVYGQENWRQEDLFLYQKTLVLYGKNLSIWQDAKKWCLFISSEQQSWCLVLKPNYEPNNKQKLPSFIQQLGAPSHAMLCSASAGQLHPKISNEDSSAPALGTWLSFWHWGWLFRELLWGSYLKLVTFLSMFLLEHEIFSKVGKTCNVQKAQKLYWVVWNTRQNICRS